MRLPAASAAQAVISEMTSPAPCPAARRRNGASVTPDIGANKTGLGSGIGPMEMLSTGTALEWARMRSSSCPAELLELPAYRILRAAC